MEGRTVLLNDSSSFFHQSKSGLGRRKLPTLNSCLLRLYNENHYIANEFHYIEDEFHYIRAFVIFVLYHEIHYIKQRIIKKRFFNNWKGVVYKGNKLPSFFNLLLIDRFIKSVRIDNTKKLS